MLDADTCVCLRRSHQAAADNKKFIDGFMLKFPEYKSRDFYLTSESYGGHYLPTLASVLVSSGMPNFKGFAVGNPLTWMPFRDYGQYAQYANRQLVPKPMWDEVSARQGVRSRLGTAVPHRTSLSYCPPAVRRPLRKPCAAPHLVFLGAAQRGD